MYFSIKQNATLPLLRLSISKDGRSDFNKILTSVTGSSIVFSMINSETNKSVIINRSITSLIYDSSNGVSEENVYIYIQFKNKDTKKVGKYQIKLYYQDSTGTVMLPLKEEVYVMILDSFIINNLEYSSEYVLNNPCC